MLGSFKKSKQSSYLRHYDRLYQRASQDGLIKEFDRQFYNRFEEKYYCGIPVGSILRYYHPENGYFSSCGIRGILLSYGFPKEARIMYGNQKALIYRDHKENPEHCWVEYEGWCYDPALLACFETSVYYHLMGVGMASEIYDSKARFKSAHYREVYYGNIKDFLPRGCRRKELNILIPYILQESASLDDEDTLMFRAELNAFLLAVDFDFASARRTKPSPG